jgi:hypothetical protein
MWARNLIPSQSRNGNGAVEFSGNCVYLLLASRAVCDADQAPYHHDEMKLDSKMR